MFETTLGASRAATSGLTPNKKIREYVGINRGLVLGFLYRFYKYIIYFNYKHKTLFAQWLAGFNHDKFTRV